MHLQPIKVCKTSTVLDTDEDLISDEEELDCVQPQLAFPGGDVQPTPQAARQQAAGSAQEDELTKAMAHLSTTHFVPRAVQVRDKK